MEKYSFIDVKINNPLDFIRKLSVDKHFMHSHEKDMLERINVEFNEQIQLLNLNKHILSKSSATPSQIKSALQSLVDIIEKIKNMYSFCFSFFKKSSNQYSLDEHFNEIVEKYKDEISNLEDILANLLRVSVQIDVAQIREISLVVPKLSAFSAYDKVNKFFGYMANYNDSITSSAEVAKDIFESNIMFVQIHEMFSFLDPDLEKLIPDTLQSFIENYTSLNDYSFNYIPNLTLAQQDISEESKEFIAYLDYFYWADDNGKSEIESAWSNLSNKSDLHKESTEDTSVAQDEGTYQFTSSDSDYAPVPQTIDEDNSSIPENQSLVIKKENFFTRLFRKIKSLFQKHITEVN